jgi:GNAT superfamily N-acetyltransferase
MKMNGSAGSTNVNVRLATEADAALLAKLRLELRAAMYELREDKLEFIERCTGWMQKRLASQERWNCWIAECDASPVGSVWVQLIEKIPNPVSEPEYYVYLTNFYVSEEYRGKGIGSKLLAEALAWSRSKNAELVLLWPSERSKPLYLRHGFLPADDFMELMLPIDELAKR